MKKRKYTIKSEFRSALIPENEIKKLKERKRSVTCHQKKDRLHATYKLWQEGGE